MTDYTETVWVNGGAPPISAANLQKIESGIDDAHQELQDHIDDTVDAHDASAISNVAAGKIVATDVQTAINELDTEKVAKAGDTMTGLLSIQPASETASLSVGKSGVSNGIINCGDNLFINIDSDNDQVATAFVIGKDRVVGSGGTTLFSVYENKDIILADSSKIIGGTATTADLTLQTTSGVGDTGADMHFLVGNNGATEAVTILNSGNVGIGFNNPSSKLYVRDDSHTGNFLIVDGEGQTTGHTAYFYSNSAGHSGNVLRVYEDNVTATSAALYVYTDATNGIIVERGNVGIGITSPSLQFEVAKSATYTIAGLSTWSAAAYNHAPNLNLMRSKSSTIGTQTAVVASDFLGSINFQGSDGDEFITAAVIRGDAEGTISNNVVPGRLVFQTANSAGTVTEAMRIDSAGDVGIGVTDPLFKLDVRQTTNTRVGYFKNENASFTDSVLILDTTKAANSNFKLFDVYSNGVNEAYIDGVGNTFLNGELYGTVTSNQFSNLLSERLLNITTAPKFLNTLTGTPVTDAANMIDVSTAGHNGTYKGTWAASQRINKGFGWMLSPNGTDNYITLGDSDDFSFGNGTTDTAFTIAGVIEVLNTASAQSVIGKWDGTTGLEKLEWLVQILSDEKLRLLLCDNSATPVIFRTTDAALSTGFHTFVVTYSGVGGATAANGITIYVDGAVVASTATNDVTYVAMENLTTSVFIGVNTGAAALDSFMTGDFTPPIIDKGYVWGAYDVNKFHQLMKGIYNL